MYNYPAYSHNPNRNYNLQHGDQRFIGPVIPFLTGLAVGPILYGAFRPYYYPYPPYPYYQPNYQPSPYYQENIYYVNPGTQQPYYSYGNPGGYNQYNQ